MPIETINPLLDPDWDKQLETFPDSTVFHRSAWLRTLCDTYGYQPSFIVEKSDGKATAILPLLEIDSWLTGKRAVGLPFTDECEPLATSQSGFDATFETAQSIAKDRGWKRIELRGGQAFLPEAEPSTRFYTHGLDLHPSESVLFEQLSSANRRAIRKAEKSDLTLEFSNERPAIEAFYRLLSLTRRRHGLPPQPYRFFEKLSQHLIEPRHGVIALAKLRGQPIAGAVFLHHGRRALYKFGASNEAHQSLRSNNLVMWKAIQWHLQNGFETLGFGRTSLGNEGLRSFKLGWHAMEKIKSYYRFDLPTRTFAVDADRESGWHNRVFRLMPSLLSRLAGRLLYPHIG